MLPIAIFPCITGVALGLLVKACGGTVRPPWTRLPVQASALRAVVARWTHNAETRQLAVVTRRTVVAVDRMGVVHLVSGDWVTVTTTFVVSIMVCCTRKLLSDNTCYCTAKHVSQYSVYSIQSQVSTAIMLYKVTI